MSIASRNPMMAREMVAAHSKPRLTWVGIRIRALRSASRLAATPEAKMQKLASRGALSKPALTRV
jgi:hypothetical protein